MRKQVKVDGVVMDRIDYIRTQFEANRSRGEIAKELGVRYQIVYQATKNMVNERHNNTTTGRTAYIEINGVQVSRKEYIQEQYLSGRSRGEIAKELGVPYQTVFQATKKEIFPDYAPNQQEDDMVELVNGKRVDEVNETTEELEIEEN